MNDYTPKFKKLMGLENVETSYGGYLPKKTSNYFPPELNIRGDSLGNNT